MLYRVVCRRLRYYVNFYDLFTFANKCSGIRRKKIWINNVKVLWLFKDDEIILKSRSYIRLFSWHDIFFRNPSEPSISCELIVTAITFLRLGECQRNQNSICYKYVERKVYCLLRYITPDLCKIKRILIRYLFDWQKYHATYSDIDIWTT